MKCSVTGCKSNYTSTSENGNVSVFRIPTDENLRRKWLKKIPRKDWIPTPSSRVCEKQFDSKYISREEVFTDKEGQRKTYPRKKPVLMKDAVPTIFPNVPNYLSCSAPVEREPPEKRRKQFEERHEKAVEQFLASDMISDFKAFVNSYKNCQ